MVTYNVDTDPRIRIYFVLAFVSIVGASFLTDSLKALASFLTDHLKDLETVLPFIVAPSLAPFAMFGILLWLFDRHLWKLPLIRRASGIPDLEGTWTGKLTRTPSADGEQGEPTKHSAMCYITQTWRSMGVVFYDFVESEEQVSEEQVSEEQVSEEQVSEEPTRVATGRTVGLFVKNPQDIHVRYVYGARQTTMLRNLNDVDAMPSEGAVVLRLRDLGKGNKRLWGTYYSDKMRRGDINLELVDSRRPREGAPITSKSSFYSKGPQP